MSQSNLPIDTEYLQQISDGDLEFELELLQVYIDDTRIHIDATKAAIAEGDFLKIEQEAHHIKGASGNVGANDVHAFALAIEKSGVSKTMDGVPVLLEQLEQKFSLVESFVAERAASIN
ncbi:Hpt domain-containing protein [Tumidithrix helvetica PCC 7403]|uniref:Hpt domain-containing protein n=1 Tax=Tumidithrix helvetica TaxID=3457545 RepID=UPI003CBA2A74